MVPRLPGGQVVVASATEREVGGEELAHPPPIQTRGHHVHGLVHESWTGLLDPVGSDHTAEGCGFGCGCGSSWWPVPSDWRST